MKKIVSLFQRNYDGDRLVRDELVPGAEWVVQGVGVATKKFDGTCCLMRGGQLFKRHELKAGKQAPVGFEPAQPPDPVTGDIPGWAPVGDGPDDARHREALANTGPIADGTYELCGPKVQKNPEKLDKHVLIRHGSTVLDNVPLSYDGLKSYLATQDMEGIVWHHPDGRMVKIKGKDFGLVRGA